MASHSLSIFVVCLFCVSCGLVVSCQPTSKPPSLDASSVADLQAVVDVATVDFAHALLPERLEGSSLRVPRDSLPKEEMGHAAKWMRRMIRSKWLPPNLENKMTGLRDSKISERWQDGMLLSRVVGDFIVVNYDTRDARVHVVDDGYQLSVRVDRIGNDPQPTPASMLSMARDILNVPEKAVPGPGHPVNRPPVVARQGGLSYVVVNMDGGVANWWHRIGMCQGPNLFYVSCPEQDETVIPPANPGLRNRF